jgi:hypothetical protein
MNTQTPIISTLLTIVRDYGHNKAVAWLDGEEELAKPDDDLCSFLSRSDTEWDQLTTADQDALRDVYIESVKTTMTSRVSSPVTVEVPSGKPGGPSSTSGSLDRVHSDVPPLGELHTNLAGFTYIVLNPVDNEQWLLEAQGDCVGFGPVFSMNYFYRNHVESLIAHLQAWLSTGSFALTPPVSTQRHGDASSAADCQYTPPSPEKPVVQPAQSDSAGLLEEAKIALQTAYHWMFARYKTGSPCDCDAMKTVQEAYFKLNA